MTVTASKTARGAGNRSTTKAKAVGAVKSVAAIKEFTDKQLIEEVLRRELDLEAEFNYQLEPDLIYQSELFQLLARFIYGDNVDVLQFFQECRHLLKRDYGIYAAESARLM